MIKSARVLCPYYRREMKRSLSCEGFILGTQNQICFSEERKKWKWRRYYCEKHYRLCPLEYMLDRKYE